jgi:membrane-associated protease RseP (regulator of RpoE activity)
MTRKPHDVRTTAFAGCALALLVVVLPAQQPLPVQPPSALPPSAQPPPALPPSLLPLRLTGVMVDDKPASNSSCFVRCLRGDERHGALRVGDVACEVAEIKGIREDGIILRNLSTDRLEFLTFPPDATKPAAPREPASAPLPRPGANPPDTLLIEVPKASVERYLSNLGELLQSALAVPHYREAADGKRVMEGFAISRIQAGGAADQAGLKDGDVVLEVNGQPLDSVATVMSLFNRMANLSQAKVVLLRDSKRLTLVVNVR